MSFINTPLLLLSPYSSIKSNKDNTEIMLPYNKKLVPTAKALRKNMTPEEKHIWYDFLKRLPIEVKRQKNIESYIVDFYIPKAKIVIEIDGSQHKTSDHKASDKERDTNLAAWGITVLRYSNDAVNTRFGNVCSDIMSKLGIKISDLKPITHEKTP